MSEEIFPKTNIPEFSVSDLAFSLKRTLEETYGRVRVRGELSRISLAGSGHMYSALKDAGAVVDAVCWKGTLQKLSIKPEEGLEVICTGRISTFPQRSNYQLVIETMELAGAGALLKMLEDRKKKLSAEGLFNPDRKKPLPFLPQTIGVITSPTGAVIRDILHRLSDRFPRHVLVWPVLVQGAGAAEQIVSAIQGFQTLGTGPVPCPDVIILARGGGSLEDLMPFNEEAVVRAVAACRIPVISAIGHETDTTLVDYASDFRAPTPTGAAERVVPVRRDLVLQGQEIGYRLAQGLQRTLFEKQQKLELSVTKMGDPQERLAARVQRLDYLSDRLAHVFTRYVHVKHRALLQAEARIKSPEQSIFYARKTLLSVESALGKAVIRVWRDKQTQTRSQDKMLEAYSFKNVLNRGFTVVRSAQGHLLTQADQVQSRTEITIEFQGDRHVQATVRDFAEN